MSDLISFYIPGTKSFETDNEAGKITLTDSKEAKSSIIIPRSKIASSKRICDTLIVGYNWDGTYPDGSNPDNPTPSDPSKPYYDPNYPDDPWWGIEPYANIDALLDDIESDRSNADEQGNDVSIKDHIHWHEYPYQKKIELHHIIDFFVKNSEVTYREKFDYAIALATFGYLELDKWRVNDTYLYRQDPDKGQTKSYMDRYQSAFNGPHAADDADYYAKHFGSYSVLDENEKVKNTIKCCSGWHGSFTVGTAKIKSIKRSISNGNNCSITNTDCSFYASPIQKKVESTIAGGYNFSVIAPHLLLSYVYSGTVHNNVLFDMCEYFKKGEVAYKDGVSTQQFNIFSKKETGFPNGSGGYYDKNYIALWNGSPADRLDPTNQNIATRTIDTILVGDYVDE